MSVSPRVKKAFRHIKVLSLAWLSIMGLILGDSQEVAMKAEKIRQDLNRRLYDSFKRGFYQ